MTVNSEISSELQHLMSAKKHLQPAALDITMTTNEQKRKNKKKNLITWVGHINRLLSCLQVGNAI